MSTRHYNTWFFAKLAIAAVILIACVIGIQSYLDENAGPSKLLGTSNTGSDLNFDDTLASYQVLRYVVDQGGDRYQRQLAIDWLDEQARLQRAPSAEQESWLLSVIDSGGHPDWDIETQLWLFNNAFNYLHRGHEHEKLTALLQQLALEHPHKTMRLYALQHIELQRSIGNLTSSVAENVHATLYQLANEADGEVVGTALVALANWDGPETQPSRELVELALELAADPELADDIRVTAIHAVGDRTLPLARTLASDTAQPVLVRKAAIACIGKYGTKADTRSLQQLAKENFRIAQAAEPALKSINRRQTSGPARQVIQL